MIGSSATGLGKGSVTGGIGSATSSGSKVCATSGTVKKMVIKPFKVQPKVPDNFGLETWETLKAAVNAVYSKSAISIGKEELYRDVESLCLHKMSAKIYELLSAECEINIRKKVESLVAQTSDHKIFLSLVDEVWKDHCEQLNTIRNIFLYLDRSYALTNTGVKCIWDLGNDIFRRHLEVNGEVQTKIIKGVLHSIDLYRQGQHYDDEIIGRIIRLLITLDIYAAKFESPFLLDTKRFFSFEGDALIHTVDTAQFLQLVDKRFLEAAEMVRKYLDSSTKRPLMDTVERYLLKPHAAILIERGFKSMLENNRREEVKRMFILYERIGELNLLKQAWAAYILEMGEGLMSNAAATKTFVEECLEFQEKLEGIWKVSFFSNESFKVTMQRCFEEFLNSKPQAARTTTSSSSGGGSSGSGNGVMASELVAKFVDKKMRGEKGVSESDVELLLDKVMTLFRYLQDKDMFEAFYKKYLSKRLLLGKSSSYELERCMLAKLKTECGSNFTSKLEGMFQDVELSREVQQAFSNYCSNSSSNNSIAGGLVLDMTLDEKPTTTSSGAVTSGPEMLMQVLTTGYWPTAPTHDSLLLPPELALLRNKFAHYYTNKYQGRRLVHAPSLERCLVTARFPKGKKDLEVSLFQAIVLLCFNKSEVRTFEAIRAATGIDEEELKVTLQSLACGMVGTRVLTKEPKGRDVDPVVDKFYFNADFTNKLFRIKINTIQLKETTEEVQKTHEDVFRDREYQVDAVIVRTMKSRKRLSHAMLMSELMSQLKFPAQVSDLKKRIESLIERDYLERDQEDSSYYNYLA